MKGGHAFEYTAAAFLTRLFIGVMFFVSGLGKFVMGYSNYTAAFTGTLARSWVPSIFTTPVVYVVPLVELVVGILLVVGLWTDKVLFAAGVTLIVFSAGALSIGFTDTLAFNAVYLIVTAIALYLRQYDKWKIR